MWCLKAGRAGVLGESCVRNKRAALSFANSDDVEEWSYFSGEVHEKIGPALAWWCTDVHVYKEEESLSFFLTWRPF